MNKPFRLIATTIAALSAISLGAGPAKAQVPEGRPGAVAVPAARCPNPVHYVITRPTVSGSQQPVTVGTYNQTSLNQHFQDTFTFPKPQPGQCCQYSRGILTVTYKALQSGSPSNPSTSWNDSGGIGPHPYIWQPAPPNNTVTAGQIKPNVPYTLSAAQLASGSVTLYVEDDTAVVSATLEITGCCLTPNVH